MDIGSPGLVPVSEKAPLDDPKPTPADTTTDPNNIANHGFTHKELEMFEKLLDNLRGNLGKAKISQRSCLTSAHSCVCCWDSGLPYPVPRI